MNRIIAVVLLLIGCLQLVEAQNLNNTLSAPKPTLVVSSSIPAGNISVSSGASRPTGAVPLEPTSPTVQISATITQTGRYSYTGVQLITIASKNDAQPTDLPVVKLGAAVVVGLLAGGF